MAAARLGVAGRDDLDRKVRRARKESRRLPYLFDAIAADERHVGRSHRIQVALQDEAGLRRVYGPEAVLLDVLC